MAKQVDSAVVNITIQEPLNRFLCTFGIGILDKRAEYERTIFGKKHKKMDKKSKMPLLYNTKVWYSNLHKKC